MNEPGKALDLEPRWPLALAVVVTFALSLLPGRVRAFPPWVVFIIVCVVIAPMAGVRWSGAKHRWLRIESVVTLLFVVTAGAGMMLDLKDLFVKMVTPPTGITGIQLLNSSISLWATNVLTFSMLYWRVDRGGTAARAERAPKTPDWLFPREQTDHELLPAWRPTFVDYLFLAYCTATAFTPAEAMPMTSRAKVLMMAEGMIGLITLLAVASRAIGLLGS